MLLLFLFLQHFVIHFWFSLFGVFTENRCIELHSPDGIHSCILRATDSAEALIWFNALHSAMQCSTQRALNDANRALMNVIGELKFIGWLSRRLSGSTGGGSGGGASGGGSASGGGGGMGGSAEAVSEVSLHCKLITAIYLICMSFPFFFGFFLFLLNFFLFSLSPSDTLSCC